MTIASWWAGWRAQLWLRWAEISQRHSVAIDWSSASFWEGRATLLDIQLRDPNPRDLATFRTLDSTLLGLRLEGRSVGDELPGELPDFSTINALGIRKTTLTGIKFPGTFNPNTLDIRDSPVTDEGLRTVAANAMSTGNLAQIHLEDKAITGQGVGRLFLLRPPNAKPVSLTVVDKDFTDSDILNIGSPPLSLLHLDCPRVTGPALATFIRRTPLSVWMVIYLDDTKVLADLSNVPHYPLQLHLRSPLRTGDGELLTAQPRREAIFLCVDKDTPHDEIGAALQSLADAGTGIQVIVRGDSNTVSQWKHLGEWPGIYVRSDIQSE